jgi:hypothetical protein
VVRRGCDLPPLIRNYKFLGIDRAVELRQAEARSRLMETMCDHFKQTGRTLKYVIFGFSGLATIEPANIAAMLSDEGGLFSPLTST